MLLQNAFTITALSNEASLNITDPAQWMRFFMFVSNVSLQFHHMCVKVFQLTETQLFDEKFVQAYIKVCITGWAWESTSDKWITHTKGK